MNYESVKVILGCEIHVQLLTKSKAFCACANSYGGTPNTRVCPICLGLPGALPNVNRELLHKGVQVSHVLGCSIDPNVRFDRKHYMYPDLTKGYQITQNNFPIGSEGKISFELERTGEQKSVRIQRAHMEEDTGKSLHMAGASNSYIDYNRGGSPLLEIVSYPDMNSSEEAVAYVKAIHEIVRYMGFSDGNMEEGSFRCDVNVNLEITKEGQVYKTPIVELKNINSFKMIKGAIEYEIVRQQEEFAKTGLTKDQAGKQTRGWNDKLGVTTSLREKESVADYRYFREPDIPMIHIGEEILKGWISEVGELPSVARERLKESYGLSNFDVSTLTNDIALVSYFEEAVKGAKEPKKIANWILTEVNGLLNTENKTIKDFNLAPKKITDLVNLVSEGKINGVQAKEVFSLMYLTNKDSSLIVEEKGFEQEQDLGVIEAIVDKVLMENPKSVADYKGGKEASLKYLMGQVMKHSQGKVNPVIATEWILKKIGN